MNRTLLIFVFIILCFNSVKSKGHYAIISPGTIHDNSNYTVSVSATQKCQIQLSLKGPNFKQTQKIQIEPMSVELVQFQIADIRNGTWKLLAKGLTGLRFENETVLDFENSISAIYIQTDKPVYKTGDVMHFRVIFLDRNALPAEINNTITIFIRDSLDNRIDQFSNVTLTNGVFAGTVKLSEILNLGSWVIDVQIDGLSIQTKNFLVNDYVLQTYEVVINAPKAVSIQDENLSFTVTTRHIFGKLAKGKLTATIESYRPSEKKFFTNQKTFDSTGKTHVEFKLNEILPQRSIESNIDLKIVAMIEDELTDKKYNATAVTSIVPYRYVLRAQELDFDCDNPETEFDYSVFARNLLEEPVKDEKNPVRFKIYNKISDVAIEKTAYFNQSGVATITLKCSTENNSIVTVFYRNHGAVGSVNVPIDEESQLKSLNVVPSKNSFKLSEDVYVKVKSHKSIPYFVYVVVARGAIIANGLIEMTQEQSHRFTLKLQPRLEMMPSANIFVYYIENNALRFAEADFKMERDVENYISIAAPNQAMPGETVALKIDTVPGSYVGLLGVDQSMLLYKSDYNFNSDIIQANNEAFQTATPREYLDKFYNYPGEKSGLITMTNAKFPTDDQDIESKSVKKKVKKKKVVEVRSNFSETWLFEDIQDFSADKSVIRSRIPDTITSWAITGFSLNPNTGFISTETPTVIQSFKSFFLTTDLPYSAKRDEQVDVPVFVHNNMKNSFSASITLESKDNEFDIIDKTKSRAMAKETLRLRFVSNDVKKLKYTIRPKKHGYISLKLTAKSGKAVDTIIRQLKVIPKGVTIRKNQDFYLHGKQNDLDVSQSIKLDIPENIVPDSAYIRVAVMGNILGSTVSNFDNLIDMPTGCGEQTMIKFAPIVHVLKYLETSRQLSSRVEKTAKEYLKTGYQHELTFRHKDGSFSAFKTHKKGSTWLTAYVLRYFCQAAKYIDIDPKIVNKAFKFLANAQASNGSFVEIGKIRMASIRFNDVSLTAFVLLAFLENAEHRTKYQDVIARALNYLESQVDHTTNLLALALTSHVLQLLNSPIASEALTSLDAQSENQAAYKWWSNGANKVEITSYALMTMLKSGRPVLPIVNWLVAQRNSNGGFSSTQDTVVALESLTQYIAKTDKTEAHLFIRVFSNDAEQNSIKFIVNQNDSLLMQTHEFQTDARKIAFSAVGKGAAILQISYGYNIIPENQNTGFRVSITQIRKALKDLQLEACAALTATKRNLDVTESNMVIMEIDLPTGYIAHRDSFADIEKLARVERVESKNKDTSVIVYLESLRQEEPVCVTIKADLAYNVTELKPALVYVYDYYDKTISAALQYKIQTRQMDEFLID